MWNKKLRHKSKLIFALTGLLFFVNFTLFAQQNFNEFYKKSDPAGGRLDLEVKKSLHQKFLNDAISANDTMKIILGNLYLSNDLKRESDYTLAMDHLIQADNLASAKNDTLLLGRINHKKGAVFSILVNHTDAIRQYEISLAQSIAVKDSQYIAITLEQLGALYGYEGDFEKSNQYYQKSIPLVEKYWEPKNLATTYSNYGKVLEYQDSTQRSIEAFKQAIIISESIQDTYRIIPAKQHLAFAYSQNDSLKKALELHWECIAVNKRKGWLDFLIYSYYSIFHTYEKMGNMDSAYHYAQAYYVLNDSVMGVQVYDQIAELEAKAKVQKKNIEILVQKEATLRQKQNLKNTIIIAIVLLTLGSWIALYFFIKNRMIKLRLKENRKTLKELTTQLVSKNAELRDLKIKLLEVAEENKGAQKKGVQSLNLYDLRILTKADWSNFKALFEKSYPNFLQKVRKTFPNITASEERLFIFIKLNLNNQESADILGVRTESIIKSRMRLRKKLGLNKDENMNHFIQTFKSP